MKPVYAYYSNNTQYETLRDHIREALKVAEKMERVSNYGFKLSKNFPLILKLSIILHDSGKVVFNQYFFNPNRELSFRGHEFVSAWFAYNLGEVVEKSISKPSRSEWDVIAFSIINHHHPMQIFDRCRALYEETFSRYIINEETIDLFIKETEIDEILKDEELREILEFFKNDSFLEKIRGHSLKTIAEYVCGDYGLYSNLWRRVWFNAEPKIRQLFLLNEQALVAADYYSASINRGEAKSEFGRATLQFVKLYSSIYHLALNGT